MQSSLFPISEPFQPVAEADLVAGLTAAIRDARGGRLTRETESYLAGVSAEYVVDWLAKVGWRTEG